MPLLIHLVAAARPNFMKIAPLYHALKKEAWAKPAIIHTGQHYDINMSDLFFRDLGLPEADFHLGVGSGSHAEQTGQVMINYEKILLQEHPNLVIVVGDVNSTLAATIAAIKLGIKVAHLEAGLRSFDRSMPEEINRIATDALADLLWTPSPDGDENLLREGIPSEKIHRVGNIMIDSLEMLRGRIEKKQVYRQLGLEPARYALVTMHRPSNVDDPAKLAQLCLSLGRISQEIPLVFPVHPRTAKNLQQQGLASSLQELPDLILLDPLSYLDFMNLVFHCRLAITDSGGIQEETTYLGIPCLTVRPNTERPITTTAGTNRLCQLDELETQVKKVLAEELGKSYHLDLWDGRTAQRIIASLRAVCCTQGVFG